MKSFITALVIAICLICGSIFHLMRFEDESRMLAQINSEAATLITSGDFKGAEKKIEEMERRLKSFEPFSMAMSNHEETDKIHTGLAELRIYTRSGNTADALAKSALLDYLFEHLPDNSRLKYENIL